MSIVAAGVRFFLNLVAVPAWTVKPVEDLPRGQSSDEAKKLAEFAQDCIENMDTAWTRVVRRSGMFRFHGFGIQEWTAKKREDGFIGLRDLEQRPQHTIERWELADDGTIIGMWQRWPQNGQLLFLPREKVVYLVDDMMTDSPEGLGLFRHLVEPAERIRRYLKMEGIGYERDMRGLPIGKAPLAEIRQQVANGTITQADADKAISAIRRFVQLQAKEEDTSILLDSSNYVGPTADGYTVSQVAKWDVQLLKAGAVGFKELGDAIDRVTHDMARILGVETLLLGSHGGGGGGSRALSEDKSRNLYLAVDSTVDGHRRGHAARCAGRDLDDERPSPALDAEAPYRGRRLQGRRRRGQGARGHGDRRRDHMRPTIRPSMMCAIFWASRANRSATALRPWPPPCFRGRFPPKGGAVAPGGGAEEPSDDGGTDRKVPIETSASHVPTPGPAPQKPGSPQTHDTARNTTSSSTIKSRPIGR